MKNFAAIRQFSTRLLIAASLCPLLAACTSMSVDDLALGNQPSAPAPSQPANQAQAQQTEAFPNLNQVATPAAPQITQEERQQLIDQLSAKRPSGAGGPMPSEAERLQRLAAEREAEVLSTIESTH